MRLNYVLLQNFPRVQLLSCYLTMARKGLALLNLRLKMEEMKDILLKFRLKVSGTREQGCPLQVRDPLRTCAVMGEV